VLRCKIERRILDIVTCSFPSFPPIKNEIRGGEYQFVKKKKRGKKEKKKKKKKKEKN